MRATTADAAERLLLRLDNLPTGSGTALEVLWLADDPEIGVGELGRTIMRDPGLTTRVMRVANSAYYGLSGRVTSATFAISVLGVDTVRAIAAAAAAGIEDARALPPGFLATSASTAVATALVAPRIGAHAPEAHSLGLLHNMGRWLLCRADPIGYPALLARAAEQGVEPDVLESDLYGTRNGEVAAALLATWRFPTLLTEAIADQHGPDDHPRSPLGAALHTGRALARLALAGGAADPAASASALALCYAERDAAMLVARVTAEAGQLEAALAL